VFCHEFVELVDVLYDVDFLFSFVDLTEVVAVVVSRALQPYTERLNTLSQEHNIMNYDIWTESGRSTAEQTAFKNRLIEYYNRKETTFFSTPRLKCMILNRYFPSNVVIASHIWKNKMHGVGLSKFGLTVQDATSPRNGFLMLKMIEERFDIKDVCFLYDPFKGRLTLKVLNPDIMDIVVSPSTKTFRDLDGELLRHPSEKFPFRRILNFHAKCAYKRARERQWNTVGDDESVNDYFNLSEGGYIPEIED
jgi:hypothetical protein